MLAFERDWPRAVCGRCNRPSSVCYCTHLPRLETRTRVVVFQHPRERDKAIGTARMASLCLADAELYVGIRWSGTPELARALGDPARPPVLLSPGEGAIDLAREPPEGLVTLIVVDGTWSQAKRLVRENPELASVPRYFFTPPRPSDYRIRKEPRATYVSTIEALAYALGVLEGDASRFAPMLRPFSAMVDAQLGYMQREGNSRHLRKRRKSPVRPPLAACLKERTEDIVCVVGEANAWPYRLGEMQTAYPDELVQWAAVRVGTGETFEAIARPRHPVAPGTATHTRLSKEALENAESVEALLGSWRAFVREHDIVCSWGHYATSLFVAAGGSLPDMRVDLRHVARELRRGKVGTLEGFAETLELSPVQLAVSGRAGVRLALTAAIAKRFGEMG
jgi:DTW domain-containing protein